MIAGLIKIHDERHRTILPGEKFVDPTFRLHRLSWAAGSKHRILIGRLWWNALKHIPMLDDLTVGIEPEDVDAGPVCVTWPLLTTMQHDVILFSENSLEVNSLSGVFRCHPVEVGDERLLTVRDSGVVLNVLLTCESFDCFSRLALVEHQVIERNHVPLVLFKVNGHRSVLDSTRSVGP